MANVNGVMVTKAGRRGSKRIGEGGVESSCVVIGGFNKDEDVLDGADSSSRGTKVAISLKMGSPIEGYRMNF